MGMWFTVGLESWQIPTLLRTVSQIVGEVSSELTRGNQSEGEMVQRPIEEGNDTV